MNLIFKIFVMLIISINLSFAVHFTAGNFTPSISVQDPEGDRSYFSLNPYIGLGFKIPIFGNHFFVPEVHFALHTSVDDDYGGQSKNTLFLLYDFAYPFNNEVILRYGFGTFITSIGGDGGTVTIPNGNSTTTAYKPGKSSTSYTSSLNLGVEFIKQVREYLMGTKLETYLFTFLSSEKRSFGHTISLTLYY